MTKSTNTGRNNMLAEKLYAYLQAPKHLFFLCLAACLLFASCSSPENKAAELYELAAFEQQQFNRDNALQLYDRILADYPDTEAAKKATAAREQLLSKKQ